MKQVHVQPRFQVLEAPVNTVTVEELLGHIARAIESKSRFIGVSQNLHSIYLRQKDEAIRKLQDAASCVRIDGMPLVLFARLRGKPVRREHRSGWMDILDPFMARAADEGWRIYYVGSKPAVAETAMAVLRKRYPALEIAGHHGYFPIGAYHAQSAEVVKAIKEYSPDIIMVGMGMPKQEHWILQNLDALDHRVILTCGACMDYVAGVQALPPRWLGRIGMEWLYRLMKDPKRLWFRYLVEPWVAVQLFAREVWHSRRG